MFVFCFLGCVVLLCDMWCLEYVGCEGEVLGGPFTCVYILGGCGVLSPYVVQSEGLGSFMRQG